MGETAALRGRTVLLTGGSDGIGLEIVRVLAGAGARILLPVRDREKGDAAIDRIRGTAPDARIEPLDLDLARLDSVDALAALLLERGEPIGALVLNAGIIAAGDGRPRRTVDGFDRTIQTNYLGHAALTLRILPLLRAGRARVVAQSSLAASGARRLDVDALWATPRRPYPASKIAIGMLALELDRRGAAEGWGVTGRVCHPGVAPGSAIAPGLRARLPRGLVRWGSAHLGNPPALAAQPAIAALLAEGPEPRMHAPGGPFGLAGPPIERAPFPSIADPGTARRLWDETVRRLDVAP